MKHPMTSRWNVVKTSEWYFSTTSYRTVVTKSQKDVTTTSHQHVSTTSQTSLKWNTQRRLSATLPRRLSGSILDVPIVRLYDASCKSQIKHPITLLWYVSTTSRCYVFATSLVGLYYAFRLPCHNVHLVGFYVSFKYQIKPQVFLVPTTRETKSVVWIIN